MSDCQKNGIDLSVYVFKIFLNSICDWLEKNYYRKCKTLGRRQRNQFQDLFIDLLIAIECGSAYEVSQLGTLVESDSHINESKLNIGLKFGFDYIELLNADVSTLRKKIEQGLTEVKSELRFHIETELVSTKIKGLLDCLNIKHMFLCIDEFSDIDKNTKFPIQMVVAQLIKQVFFKSEYFSVKIAAIWNKTKMNARSLDETIGLVYQQDIFAGPDLDIMFLHNNDAVLDFFKEIVVNTYLLDTKNVNDTIKKGLSDMIIDKVFGLVQFRHLVCGSQGIARGFAILMNDYIRSSISHGTRLPFDELFQIIIKQYLDGVRRRIPYNMAIPKEISSYVTKNKTRYFLISKPDYDRCERIIKVLASADMFIQFPGHKTPRELRDDYKLFLINYGNYLDSLNGHSGGLKMLGADSKLINNGMLFPDIPECFINHPSDYTVTMPNNSENQYFCSCCDYLFYENNIGHATCPKCGA